mgnify:FL=1
MTDSTERDTSQDKAIITITNSGKVEIDFSPSLGLVEASFRARMGMVGVIAIQDECDRLGLKGAGDE